MRLFWAASILLLSASISQAQSATHSASCHVNTVKESPAQIKNDRFEFKAAATLFEQEIQANPKDELLRAAQIRNLADDTQLEAAEKLALAFVEEAPNSGIALTARAYVLYSQGHLAESYAMNAAAQKLDPCQGRTYLYLSDYELAVANWKTAWEHIQLAHKLDPLSDDVTKTWINFLPYKQS